MSEYVTTSKTEWARQMFRRGIRNVRDKNKWRKWVKVRLWMPVALQILLVGGVL